MLGSTSEAAGALRTPEPEKRWVPRAPSGEGCGEGVRAGVSGLCAPRQAPQRTTYVRALRRASSTEEPHPALCTQRRSSKSPLLTGMTLDDHPGGHDSPKETDYSPSRGMGESRLMRNSQSPVGRQQEETEKPRTGSPRRSERGTGGSCPAPSGPQAHAGH